MNLKGVMISGRLLINVTILWLQSQVMCCHLDGYKEFYNLRDAVVCSSFSAGAQYSKKTCSNFQQTSKTMSSRSITEWDVLWDIKTLRDSRLGTDIRR